MIIKKFKGLIGTIGEMFSYAILEKQIKVWQEIRRKTHRVIMPIISELLKAIIEERQVTFNLYERSFKYKNERTEFKNFSLDRYMREHIYMVTNNSPTVDVRIEFDEDFLETVLTQLTLKQIVEKSVINDKKFQTIMTV